MTKLTLAIYLSFFLIPFQIQVPEITSWSDPSTSSLSNVEAEDNLSSCKCLPLRLLQEELPHMFMLLWYQAIAHTVGTHTNKTQIHDAHLFLLARCWKPSKLQMKRL